MRHAFLALAITITAPVAIAQNCFDGNFGTLLITNPADTMLPMQPIGFPFPLGGTTYTHVHITDHGFVSLSNSGTPAAPSGAILYTPTLANFIAGPKVAALYADIIGSGGGTIWLNNSNPAQCVVTWRNMQNFGTPAPRFDFQLILYPNGDARTIFGPGVTNVSTFGVPSDNGICGITPGTTGSPAAVDLSASGASTSDTTYELWTVPLTFDLASNTMLFSATVPGYAYIAVGAPANCATNSNYGTGCDGMSLTSVGLPTIGSSGYTLRTSGVPAISPISFTGFGSTVINPGIDLTSIGMPGCFAYTSLDLGLFGNGPVVGGQSDFVLAIPANPALAGAILAAQGVALSLATPINLASSGGTQINIGYGL